MCKTVFLAVDPSGTFEFIARTRSAEGFQPLNVAFDGIREEQARLMYGEEKGGVYISKTVAASSSYDIVRFNIELTT